MAEVRLIKLIFDLLLSGGTMNVTLNLIIGSGIVPKTQAISGFIFPGKHGGLHNYVIPTKTSNVKYVMSSIKELFEQSQKTLEDLQSQAAKESKRLKDGLRDQLQIKLDSDKKYESRWVWYHSLLAIEMGIIIALLCVIAYKL
tara:strand:+ start:55 stop:483 length:429 start_codon:yes stop_codon:yes gene_type:complete